MKRGSAPELGQEPEALPRGLSRGERRAFDDASAAVRETVGVSVNAAAVAGQPVSYIKDGDLAFGAILTKGETYCVSGTPGGICPRADVTTGDDLIIIGVASSTSNLQVGLRDTGATL